MSAHFGEQRPPCRPDSGIHHNNVNGLLGKVMVRLRDGERAVGEFVGPNAVADPLCARLARYRVSRPS